MNVLSIAYPFAPVGPAAVGGAEQILIDLDGAITAAGHSSFVIACESSQTTGRLLTTPAVHNQELNERVQREVRREVQAVISDALRNHAVDIVHMHGIDFWEYSVGPGV